MNFCSGLNQGHTECFLVVFKKSTLEQKYTPHTHGNGLLKKKTPVPCQIEFKCITFWVCIPIFHVIYSAFGKSDPMTFSTSCYVKDLL
jgi:hypothetical protein